MTTAVKSNTIRPSAWPQWLDKPRVRLWEAIALSLGIDPEQVSREAGAGWAGWEVGVETSSLETDTAEFCSRLKKACSHADVNGGALRLHTPLKPAWGEAISNDLVNQAVGLADFVHWAKLMSWNLPGELLGAADEQKAEAEFTGTFAEVVSNGKAIDWRYWMSMKTLTASQSSRLMVGLDPDIFKSLDHNGPTRNDTSMQRDRARQIERLALNHGMNQATASEWISWAKSHRFNIHRLFVVEVESKEADAEVIASVTTIDRETGSDKKSSFGAPESGEFNDTTGMVAWQASILENWQAATEKHGNAITARQVMAWCKSSGPRDVFGCEQTNTRESIQWMDRTSGDVHTVTLARIGTVLSEWRSKGIIPPRK